MILISARRFRLFIFLILAIYQTYAFADAGAPTFANMGKTHFNISTRSPEAQKYFDQGLALFYAFEWSESTRSFVEAARIDPTCAMCYWGIAISLSYKSNEPITHHEFQDGLAAITEALSLKAHATAKERALIEALAIRYRKPHDSKVAHKKGTCCVPSGELSKRDNQAYVSAMNKISKQFPDDLDLSVLSAGAQFWLFGDMKESNSAIRRVLHELESVIKRDGEHIGAHHYYIHFIESLTHVERALESARFFTNTPFDSHHLVHMPSHIYFLLGRYHDASEANVRAVDTFARYQKNCAQQNFKPYFSNLYIHDLDFLRSAAMMEGRRELAISSAKKIDETLTEARLKSEPTLQWFIPISYYVNARFALWDELQQTPAPPVAYPYALAMWHYTHGLTSVHNKALPTAEQDLKTLKDLIKLNRKIQGSESLAIARELLMASISYQRHQKSLCIAHLKKALAIQKSTRYHEPPDWYFPVAEALGDAYRLYGEPSLAVKYYQLSLTQYPDNGWALFGLAHSYHLLGYEKEAKETEEKYKMSWANADVAKPISFFA